MAAALETMLQDWRERLRAWSADGSLTSAARHALELEGEQPLLDKLIAQWAAGDFSDLPPITLLPASSMPGAARAHEISARIIDFVNVNLQEANPGLMLLAHQKGAESCPRSSNRKVSLQMIHKSLGLLVGFPYAREPSKSRLITGKYTKKQ